MRSGRGDGYLCVCLVWALSIIGGGCGGGEGPPARHSADSTQFVGEYVSPKGLHLDISKAGLFTVGWEYVSGSPNDWTLTRSDKTTGTWVVEDGAIVLQGFPHGERVAALEEGR